MAAMNDEWKLRLFCNGVELLQTPIIVAEGSKVAAVNSSVLMTQPNEVWPYEASHQFVPWQDVETIAAFVRGDGSDPVRQALADGILEGRR